MPMPIKDRTGFRHGKLTVIKRIASNDKGQNMWMCACECGNTINIAGKRLKAKNCPKSCGCAIKAMIVQTRYDRHNPRESTIKAQYGTHCANAQTRGLKPLSRQAWENVVFCPCHYCGETDSRSVGHSRKKNHHHLTFTPEMEQAYVVKMNGVDRIDSTKGYEEDNCVSACRMCNIMKNGYTETEFFQRIKRIYERQLLHTLSLKTVSYSGNFLRKASPNG